MAGEDLHTMIPYEAGKTYKQYASKYGTGPVYGGRARDVGPDGKYVEGTSAADQDVARYRQMGSRRTTPPNVYGPQGRESRGMMMGSLGALEAGALGSSTDMSFLRSGAAGDTRDMRLLQDAAEGRSASRAEILGKTMSDRALRSQVSAAGNVRGGPGAAAAAYRYASMNAMGQRADMNQGIQAERAQELANARGAYSGAMGAARRDFGVLSSGARRDFNTGTSDLRAGDDRLATTQADVILRQNAEDAQNERYYEGLANSTLFGELDSEARNWSGETGQRNFERGARNAEAAADWGKTKDMIGMGVGGVTGGIGAYANLRRDAREQGAYDKDYSDVKAKEPAAITWGSLGPMTWGSESKPGEHAQDLASQLDTTPDAGDTVGTYAGGIYRSMPYEETDYKGGLFRGDPYRDTTPSDPAAKQAAFQDGFASAKTGAPKPEYMKGQRVMQSFDRTHPTVEAHKNEFDRSGDAALKDADALMTSKVPGAAVPAGVIAAGGAANKAVAGLARPEYKPKEKRAESRQKLDDLKRTSAAGTLASGMLMPGVALGTVAAEALYDPWKLRDQARQTSPSDEKTKRDFGTVPDEAMADAMRSMTPSPYRYKSEFSPPSQQPGEINVGPMANAMKKDPVAGTAIVEDEGTGMLALDKDKSLKVTMGSLAALQHQIDELKSDVPRGDAKKARYRGLSAQP